MLALIIYLIGFFEKLILTFWLLFAISFAFAGMYALLLVMDEKLLEFFKDNRDMTKKVAITYLIILFVAIAAPDRETSYALLAVYGVESVASSDEVKRLSGKSLQLIEKTIDKYLQEGAEE